MKIFVLLVIVGTALGGPSGPTVHHPHIPIGKDNPSNNRIIGGENALPGEFPWQISLQVIPSVGPKYHSCGGAILDETHVVITASCVNGQLLNSLEVVAGAHNIKNEGEEYEQRVSVRRVVMHPDYNQTSLLANDISVLTLATPLNLTGHRVKALRLATEGHEPSGACINSGWGNSNPSGAAPIVIPDALQKVVLVVLGRSNCSTLYAGINAIAPSMVCARNGATKGSCQGDSGGPLVCYDLGDNQPYLAGVVSWGMEPCGQERYPTVFANIANLRAFLDVEGARP